MKTFGVFVVVALISIMAASRIFAAAQSIPPNARFDWQLQGSPNPAALLRESGTKVFDIDPDHSSASQIASFKGQGITVICYFSAGSAEDWRSDYSKFTSADKAGPLDGWAGEYVVNVTDNVKSIMTARMQRYQGMGCDGVEPDNTDQVADPSGYIQFLSSTAHSMGLSVALKNNANLAGNAAIVAVVDFAVVEQCYEYGECDSYLPLIKAGKAVFDVEYNANPNCSDANAKNIDAYKMSIDLNGSLRVPCRTSGGPAGSPVPSSPGTGSPSGTGAYVDNGTPAAFISIPPPNVPVAPPQQVEPLQCSILPTAICGKANSSGTDGKSGTIELLKFAIGIITSIIGVAAVGGIIWASFLYTSAGGGVDQTKKAKTIIASTVIGLVLYGLVVVITNWLVPGGVF